LYGRFSTIFLASASPMPFSAFSSSAEALLMWTTTISGRVYDHDHRIVP
jgi:hypothetical protein